MRTLIAAVSVLLITPFALGQGSGDSSNYAKVKEEIRKLWGELQEAGAKRDRATLERLVADEFIFIHSTGGRENKAERINSILSITSYRAVPLPPLDQFYVYGDVAVLRAPGMGLLGTTIYAKKSGRWQVVQIQSTRLPPERKAIAVDPKLYDSYVGKYEYSPGVFTVVAKEGDTLTAQSPGRPKLILTPTSETQFFVKGNEGEWTFYKNEKGEVTGLVLRLGNCQESRGKKME